LYSAKGFNEPQDPVTVRLSQSLIIFEYLVGMH
jgi:hypothetical protein